MDVHAQQAGNCDRLQFSATIAAWLAEKLATVQADGVDITGELLQFVTECGGHHLASESITRKSRTKAIVPLYLRCQAHKADGEQCTRRRKEGIDLCGTHIKGIPHGRIATSTGATGVACVKIVTYVQEVNGINYHVDAQTKEVYRSEDVLTGSHRPRVIGKLVTTEDAPSIDYSDS